MKNIIIQSSYTDRSSKSLQIYLNELNKLSVLSREEEKELFIQYKAGSMIQREKIINHNLRFVVSIAKHYQQQGLLLEDLIEEGNIGLIRQLEKYDVNKDLKFITYQVWWIKQQMMEALSINSRTIRLPQNRILELDRIYRYISDFEQEFGRTPTTEEIGEQFNMSSQTVLTFINLDQPTMYLNDPIGEDIYLIDTI